MRTLWICLLPLAFACNGGNDTDKGLSGDDDDDDDDDSAVDDPDLAEYDELEADLADGVSDFLDASATELQPFNDNLYYRQSGSVWHWDADTDTFTEITSIANKASFKGGNELVVVAELDDGKSKYTAYNLKGKKQGEVTLTAPSGRDFWPYGPSADEVWIARTEFSSTALTRWVPGNPIENLFLFEEDAGYTGELPEDIKVLSEIVLLQDGTDVWRIDATGIKEDPVDTVVTATLAAEGIKNDVLITNEAVLWGSKSQLTYTPFDGSDPVDITVEVEGANYLLNDTYVESHFHGGDGFTRHGLRIVYPTDIGWYAYEIDTGRVEPILLEPRTDAVGYNDPLVVSNEGILLIRDGNGDIKRVDNDWLQRP